MKISGFAGSCITALCIMALLVTAANAADVPGVAGTMKNSPQAASGIQKYTMDTTLSDRGQEATIAFDGLAFLTGDACSDTFLPPGKVADYAGFQYLRDNDATQMGHNTDFVTRVSDNVLYILDSDQLARFSALSESEAPLSTKYGYMRYPLMKAFRAQLDGTIPSGSSGLNATAVMDYSAKLYDVDASISIGRAKTYADVIRSMNQTQLAYLDRMKSGGMAAMPVVDASAALRNSGQGNSVAMRTYASEMFAWYAGSVDADVYFCPERQATYFGSFYMKDRPAMGNAGYSISTTLTGDSGEAFLDTLTAEQRAKITGLVDLQRQDLNGIVATRTAIATELRKALAGGTIDEASVRALSARYGQLDGEISTWYAMRFAEVGKTLTAEQKSKLAALRNLAGYTCDGGYLYSQQISWPQDIPSDFLFGTGAYDSAAMDAWLAARQQTTIQPGPGGKTGQQQGNLTRQDPAPSGGRKNGNVTGSGPASPRPDRGENGQSQKSRIPVEEVISRLAQAGYDTTGVQAALASGDREAMKAWLGEFRKKNPGIAEGIEGTGADFARNQNSGGNAGTLRPTQETGAGGGAGAGPGKESVTGWFSGLWQSLFGGQTQEQRG